MSYRYVDGVKQAWDDPMHGIEAPELPLQEPTPEERIAVLEAQIAKLEQPKTVTDSIGNKYRQKIVEDGTVRLVLIESYNGELYE